MNFARVERQAEFFNLIPNELLIYITKQLKILGFFGYFPR